MEGYGDAKDYSFDDISAKIGPLPKRRKTQASAPNAETTSGVPAVDVPAEDVPAVDVPAAGSMPEPRVEPAGDQGAQDAAMSPVVDVPEDEEAEEQRRTQQVHLTMPTSLWTRLDAYRRTRKVSWPDAVLDAVEATHERLEELLPREQSTGGVQGRSKSALFGRRPVATPLRTEESTKTLSFKLSLAEVKVLKRLEDETGAANRQVLLRAALRGYFDALDDSDDQ